MIKQQAALSFNALVDERAKRALVAAQKTFAQNRPKPIVQLKVSTRENSCGKCAFPGRRTLAAVLTLEHGIRALDDGQVHAGDEHHT